MNEQFSRSALLLGDEAIQTLQRSHVAIFGVGGVGGAAVEALARGGVGAFSLFDNDTVSLSNLNRQLIATHDTVGQSKVEVCKARIVSINPNADVTTYPVFYLPENADEFDLSQYDYIIDAIDTVSAKIELVLRAQQAGVPIISAMGAGNKLDPTKFVVTDLYKTETCPLARVMRRELRARGVKRLKVVYSTETARKPLLDASDGVRRAVPGSVSFVPPVAGMILAGEVMRELIGHLSKNL